MDQSTSSETNSSSTSQESPCLLYNLRVHCRVHNSPPLIPILSQINPVHNHLFCFFKTQFNTQSMVFLSFEGPPKYW
jgi:hypothetical protein